MNIIMCLGRFEASPARYLLKTIPTSNVRSIPNVSARLCKLLLMLSGKLFKRSGNLCIKVIIAFFKIGIENVANKKIKKTRLRIIIPAEIAVETCNIFANFCDGA